MKNEAAIIARTSTNLIQIKNLATGETITLNKNEALDAKALLDAFLEFSYSSNPPPPDQL